MERKWYFLQRLDYSHRQGEGDQSRDRSAAGPMGDDQVFRDTILPVGEAHGHDAVYIDGGDRLRNSDQVLSCNEECACLARVYQGLLEFETILLAESQEW